MTNQRPQPLHPTLADVLIENRKAPYRVRADREEPWRIRKIGTTWYAWPQRPGVYATLFGRKKWLPFTTFDTALAEVLRRIYSK